MLLVSTAIGASLLSVTESFQAFVFDRAIELSLIGYGIVIGTVGALRGIAFTRGRAKSGRK